MTKLTFVSAALIAAAEGFQPTGSCPTTEFERRSTVATALMPASVTYRRSPFRANPLGMTPRTFDMSREVIEAGVDPVAVARSVYDSNNMGRLKLFGSVLRLG